MGGYYEDYCDHSRNGNPVRLVPPHTLRKGDYLIFLGDTVEGVSDVHRNPDTGVGYRVITLSSGREVIKKEGELCRVAPQQRPQPRPSTRGAGSTRISAGPTADND